MHRALIVDDSKTAQARLKSMLRRFELSVDVAFSAEEALGFLSYNMPDVIFMDHHMEGMDGLEALKILKANPTTATIPVIMYTSEKGDVYVGQARALGALDILSKEIIQPSNLERLLSSLKISSRSAVKKLKQKQAENKANTSPTTETLPEGAPSPLLTSDVKTPEQIAVDIRAEEMRGQVARLFELHITDVRQQISEQSQFIVRNLRSEIRSLNKKINAYSNEVHSTDIESEETPNESRRFDLASSISTSLIFLTFAAFIYLSYQLIQTRHFLDALNGRYTALAEQSEQSQRNIATLTSLTTTSINEFSATTNNENNLSIIDAIEWAVHQDLSFDYDEEPLSDRQVEKIEQLINHLNSIGYYGEVDLNIQFADVCIVKNKQEQWQLANQNHTFEDCRFRNSFQNNFDSTDYLSLAFIQFEQNHQAITEGDIAVNISFGGVVSRDIYTETPFEWNKNVMKDNIITVILTPDY